MTLASGPPGRTVDDIVRSVSRVLIVAQDFVDNLEVRNGWVIYVNLEV